MKGRRRLFALTVAAASVAADMQAEVSAILNSGCTKGTIPDGSVVTIAQTGEVTVLVKATGASKVWVKDTDDEYYALVEDYVDNGGEGMSIDLTRMPDLMYAEAFYDPPVCNTLRSNQMESWDTVVSDYVAGDRSPPPGDWEELKPDNELYKRINCDVGEETNCLLPTIEADYDARSGSSTFVIEKEMWQYGVWPDYHYVADDTDDVLMLVQITDPTIEPTEDVPSVVNFKFAKGTTRVTAYVLLPSVSDIGGNNVKKTLDMTNEVIAEIEAENTPVLELPWTSSAEPTADQLIIIATVSEANATKGRLSMTAPYKCVESTMYAQQPANDDLLLAYTTSGSVSTGLIDLDNVGTLDVSVLCTDGDDVITLAAEAIDVTNDVTRSVPDPPSGGGDVDVPTCTDKDEDGVEREYSNGQKYTNDMGQECTCSQGATFCGPVPVDDDSSSGLSTGMTALIAVLAVVLVVTPLMIAGFIFYRKRRAKQSGMNIKAVEMKPPSGPPPSGPPPAAESKV